MFLSDFLSHLFLLFFFELISRNVPEKSSGVLIMENI